MNCAGCCSRSNTLSLTFTAMPRFARLFEAAEDILEAYRDALKRRDADGALKLWLDEDSVSFILPDGQRLNGHEQLRGCLDALVEKNPVWIECLSQQVHSSLGVSIFEATEALRFSATATEADLYVHTTYVLMQNHEGWRIAHVHSSQAAEERVAASIASVTHSLH
ncbi:hypothetical protein R11007_01057 [Ralstonia holmesii]|jgi:ketosteroid isomerase-like protein|uniref:SnoaL-like domain-containing protein n=3 Tax=Ralstonia TaxID=48736 RepID=A0ABC8QBJ3_9RALS|nr:hypothetical protein R11007_01057 [Ralstonia sp. LMG 32967]CAJ0788683.1 hypothetical protein LMG18096_02144 [Ralstonia sp. LMG 32967]CAJ0809145.1 hypothetical protein LMG18093_00650 [Ralstonia sp. LMG 32967]